MKAIVYFLLCVLTWFVVCYVGWTWVLGMNPDPLKMLAVAFLNATMSTLNVVVMGAIRSDETTEAETETVAVEVAPKPAGGER